MADRSTTSRSALLLSAVIAVGALGGLAYQDVHAPREVVFYYNVETRDPGETLRPIARGMRQVEGVDLDAPESRKPIPRGLHYATPPGWDCTDAAKNGGKCKRGSTEP